MTQDQYIKSIDSGELLLIGFWQKLSYFGLVIFLFAMPIIVLIWHIIDYLQGNSTPLVGEEIWIIVIPTILGFLAYRFQKSRLKFQIIKTSLTSEQLTRIIHEVANELKWSTYFSSEKIFIAKTFPSFFTGGWGEQITILFNENSVLINSICDPDRRSSFTSLMGRNKKNVETLIEKTEKFHQLNKADLL